MDEKRNVAGTEQSQTERFVLHDDEGPQDKIESDDGKPTFPLLEQPGDYAGPVMGFSGAVPAVFFLKPNARDPEAPRCARAVQHVISPPHVFIEEPDGSLTITASIGDMHGSESDGYHCNLTKGEWIKC